MANVFGQACKNFNCVLHHFCAAWHYLSCHCRLTEGEGADPSPFSVQRFVSDFIFRYNKMRNGNFQILLKLE